jgi:hypothetical protein
VRFGLLGNSGLTGQNGMVDGTNELFDTDGSILKDEKDEGRMVFLVLSPIDIKNVESS